MIKPSLAGPLPFRAPTPVACCPASCHWALTAFLAIPANTKLSSPENVHLMLSLTGVLFPQNVNPCHSFYPIFSSNIKSCAFHSVWKSSPAHYHPSLFSSPVLFLLLTLLLSQVLLNIYLFPFSSTRILASGGQGSVLFPWKYFQEQ